MKRRLTNAWHYGLGYLNGYRDGKHYTERAILGPGGEYDAQAEVERLREGIRQVAKVADMRACEHEYVNLRETADEFGGLRDRLRALLDGAGQ